MISPSAEMSIVTVKGILKCVLQEFHGDVHGFVWYLAAGPLILGWP